MGRLMPDEETVEQARRVLKVARERGADPILALHEAGLLWFPARERELAADTLSATMDMVDGATVQQLAGGSARVPTNVADMKRLLVRWGRESAQLIRQGSS